ncbi:hypothetical protein [Paenibacillus flagellatus]|uniref:Uncharacterized protein n=1 Tax=Paenibacillus flagellatus TaxID=2211139 RepID=A0A2V5K2I8_9BACL|nr:hypothetical protein [Paenibacillus flagellatus]PYI51763.1 hypothetical protein DLM86_22845 [Paenibacillus flagellatus]
MERLFEFVKDYLGMIVVVGGFLLTALAKRRANGGGARGPSSGKPNPMMPTFGGSPRYDGPKESRGEGAAEETFRPGPAARSDSENDERPEPRGGGAASVSAARADSPAQGGASEAAPLSEEEAVRGMMWAEVLGPPRAKRPFGTKIR